MGQRDSYEPGTFSWAELATPDGAAAKEFYGRVFGWEYEDNEVPGDSDAIYTMAKREGRYVGAIFQADPPPRWNSYITVEDAEEAAEKAREAGGEVHAGPFDVGDAGRMAVIQDPTGGVFSVWEAKDHPGAGLVNAHGALTWNDLMTTDVGKASEFYAELFGWEFAPVDMSGQPADESDDADEDDDDDDDDESEGDDDSADDDVERVSIKNGERLNGGIAKLPESAADKAPPHWLPYFAVDDLDAALSAVREGDGTVMADPIEVPAGSFALVADPQGAVFAIFQGEFDD